MIAFKTHTEHFELTGAEGLPLLIDITFPLLEPYPLVIFCHGFKGFKDWGHFPLIAAIAAKQGVAWLKFNFSHNGTTPLHPANISEEDTFGKNNFTKELYDAQTVIDFITAHPVFKSRISSLHMVGHSRGGGIAILAGAASARIQSIITWASVNEFLNYWSDEEMLNWMKSGVMYIENKRTGQRLPMYYQLVDDYQTNIAALHIPNTVKALHKPMLIIHGMADEAVPYEKAVHMADWNTVYTKLILLPGATHTFGGTHPYTSEKLPADTIQLLNHTIDFIKNN